MKSMFDAMDEWMSESPHKKEWNHYKEVQNRIEELNRLLGYGRDENMDSLSKRAARGDAMSKKLMDKIRENHPSEFAELHALTAEAIDLEDKLGVTEKLEELLDSLGLDNDDDWDFLKEQELKVIDGGIRPDGEGVKDNDEDR